MRYLLDTATWANNALVPEIFPDRIRTLLETDEPKGVCSVSCLELAIHHRHGRLQVKGSLTEFFDRLLADDIELLDLTPQIAIGTNELSERFPGDPFDRTIAATARLLNLNLITPDPGIRDAGFCKTIYYPYRPARSKRRRS